MHTQLAAQPQVETVQIAMQAQTASQPSFLMAGLGAAAHRSAASRDQLVLEHMTLVRQVARTIHARVPQHVEMEELVSAGLLGLIDAAAKFDGTKQVQFRSYAQIRVRGAILDSMRSLDWSPRELRRQGRAIAEAIRTLAARLGRTPDDGELAREMGMDLRSLQQLTGELKGLELGSLNQERNEDAAEEEIDHLPAPAAENPFSLCAAGQTQERLASAIAGLPERERLVLTLYYYEELTLKEIGVVLGVVESRVSQLRAAGVARLRRMLARPGTPVTAQQPVTH